MFLIKYFRIYAFYLLPYIFLNSCIIPCIFNPFTFASQVEHFLGVASGSHCFVYFQRTDKEKAIYLVLRALRYLTKLV